MVATCGPAYLITLGFLLWDLAPKFLDLQMVGLLFDGIGAAVIGHAFFRRTARQLFREGMGWDSWQSVSFKPLVEQKFDTMLGTGFLIIGFALQAVSILVDRFVPILAVGSYLFGGGALFWYFRYERHRRVERYIRAIFVLYPHNRRRK